MYIHFRHCGIYLREKQKDFYRTFIYLNFILKSRFVLFSTTSTRTFSREKVASAAKYTQHKNKAILKSYTHTHTDVFQKKKN